MYKLCLRIVYVLFNVHSMHCNVVSVHAIESQQSLIVVFIIPIQQRTSIKTNKQMRQDRSVPTSPKIDKEGKIEKRKYWVNFPSLE